MFIFLLFLSLSVLGNSDSQFTFEKSYPRDNAFCHYKDTRIEVMIRGGNKLIEPRERGYGEFIFFRNLPERAPKLLSLNQGRGDTYKLFLGTSPQCSKSHGYMIGENTLAVLLQKENVPFKDKLVIQFFDVKTMSPKEVLETNYPTDRAIKTEDGFAFRVIPENHSPEMGRVMIEEQKFIYQERDFPEWINYTKAGFEVAGTLTYEKFPWKKAFKDQEDFFSATGWNPKEKTFGRKILYLAVNHKLKRECLLFIEAKQKIAGNESWKCQAR